MLVKTVCTLRTKHEFTLKQFKRGNIWQNSSYLSSNCEYDFWCMWSCQLKVPECCVRESWKTRWIFISIKWKRMNNYYIWSITHSSVLEDLDGGVQMSVRLSVTILAICQLSVKFWAFCQLSGKWLLIINYVKLICLILSDI